jgi:hypothetical protein
MFRPPDNMVLHLLAQQIKFLAEAGNAHRKIIIFFRIFLGVNKCFGVDYVKLDVTQPFLRSGE